MNAVDTNILIYVHDPRDPLKQSVASDLVQNLADGLLVWQSACEFLAASRKLAAYGYNFDQAFADLHELMIEWTTALSGWQVIDRGASLIAKYRLSYWDAMLIAACIDAGARTIYSENFSGHSVIDGLKIVNPFVASPSQKS
jgi:predicted nucleic acid-binding protein